ncbi:hypothetical protein TruAng_001559 [Truncatella angustata]|nr:hypothetical protein TruAng_001559 [Truncatella angustata]
MACLSKLYTHPHLGCRGATGAHLLSTGRVLECSSSDPRLVLPVEHHSFQKQLQGLVKDLLIDAESKEDGRHKFWFENKQFAIDIAQSMHGLFQRICEGEHSLRAKIEPLQAGFDQVSSKTSTNLAGSTIANSAQIGGKRAHPSFGDIDSGVEPGSGAPSIKKRRTRGALSSQGFACHFYKHNPAMHIACLGFHCKKLKDENQHLTREHQAPRFYCPVCGDTFQTHATSDAHITERTCQRRVFNFQGVTLEQAQRISSIMKSRGSDELRWFLVWDVLFPGVDRPTSPYRTDLTTEVTWDLHKYYQSDERRAIVEHGLRGLPLADYVQDGVDVVLDIFDSILEQYRAYAQAQRSALEDAGSGAGVRSGLYVTPSLLGQQEPDPVPLPSSIDIQRWMLGSDALPLSGGTALATIHAANSGLVQPEEEDVDFDQYIDNQDDG